MLNRPTNCAEADHAGSEYFHSGKRFGIKKFGKPKSARISSAANGRRDYGLAMHATVMKQSSEPEKEL